MGFLKPNFEKEGKGVSKDTPEKTDFMYNRLISYFYYFLFQ